MAALRAGIGYARKLWSGIRDESGQDFLEYALIGGAVAVVIAGILIFGFGLLVPDVLDELCGSVDPLGSSDCLTLAG